MSKRFDGTLKELLEDAPESWPILVGRPGGNVAVVDSDIGTVTGAADKVLRVSGPPAWLLHVEAQAGPDASLPMRAQVYNTLMAYRHGLPVHTTILLLRPEANLSIFNGLQEIGLPGQEPYLSFRYQGCGYGRNRPSAFWPAAPGRRRSPRLVRFGGKTCRPPSKRCGD